MYFITPKERVMSDAVFNIIRSLVIFGFAYFLGVFVYKMATDAVILKRKPKKQYDSETVGTIVNASIFQKTRITLIVEYEVNGKLYRRKDTDGIGIAAEIMGGRKSMLANQYAGQFVIGKPVRVLYNSANPTDCFVQGIRTEGI